MKETYAKLTVFLLLLGLITSIPLMTYDPTTTGATVTLLKKDQNSYRWLFKRALVGPAYSIEAVSLDLTSPNANKVSKITYNAAGTNFDFKAVSPDYTCAILTESTTKISLVKFTSNDLLLEDLIASGLVVAGTEADAVAKSYQVSSGC